MSARSRRGSRQMRHCSSSATLPQTAQNRTLSLTSVSASTSRSTSAGSACSRWKAIRCALLGPTPGSRPSSSIRSWTTPSYTRRAYALPVTRWSSGRSSFVVLIGADLAREGVDGIHHLVRDHAPGPAGRHPGVALGELQRFAETDRDLADAGDAGADGLDLLGALERRRARPAPRRSAPARPRRCGRGRGARRASACPRGRCRTPCPRAAAPARRRARPGRRGCRRARPGRIPAR